MELHQAPPPASSIRCESAAATNAGAIVPSTSVTVAATSLSDRKRLRHREYVKKSYRKKTTTLDALRRELDALDKQYTAMLQISCKGEEDAEGDDASKAKPNAPWPPLNRYLEATELKNRYQVENARLYRLNAQHMKVESRMGQLLDASEAANLPLPGVSYSRRYRIRPLPIAAYTNIIDNTRDDVLRFARSTKKLSSGARVMGWTDQREIHGTTLKFALQKEFAGVSPLELLQRSWAIFATPEQFTKVYGSGLNVQFHQLQGVDADTILFYRHIAPSANSIRVVKTVFLLARRRIDEGYVLLFRSIDKDLVHFEEVDTGGVPQISLDSTAISQLLAAELWVDKYIWVLFYDIPRKPDRCLFHFGGATNTTIWLREVLFVALRWETMAVGSQFTLTAE